MSEQPQKDSYGQFCPVAMAAEVVCSRWTPLILRELLCGVTRFNDIRRGIPRLSPTLLSKRLKELERAGIVTIQAAKTSNATAYKLTEAGAELRPIVMLLGTWGQRWVDTSLSLKNLDPSLLMWDMRRNIVPTELSRTPCTIKFEYPELKAAPKAWWLVVDGLDVDLCSFDPGHEVDLFVSGSLRSMTSVWMGISTLKSEVDAGRIELDGDRRIANAMHKWLGLSPFAKEKSRLSA